MFDVCFVNIVTIDEEARDYSKTLIDYIKVQRAQKCSTIQQWIIASLLLAATMYFRLFLAVNLTLTLLWDRATHTTYIHTHTLVFACAWMYVYCFSFTYVAVSLGTICSISSTSVISTSMSDAEEISSRSLSLISMTSIRNNKYGAVKWPLLGRSLFVLFFSSLFCTGNQISFLRNDFDNYCPGFCAVNSVFSSELWKYLITLMFFIYCKSKKQYYCSMLLNLLN